MQKTTKDNKALIVHVARLEGQLRAVRAALEADDCKAVSRTLLAASRSLSSLRASCASEFISKKVYKGAKPADAGLLEEVRSLMRA